jgi:hypothetical protein
METSIAKQQERTSSPLPAQQTSFAASLTRRPELQQVHSAMQSPLVKDSTDRELGQALVQIAFLTGSAAPSQDIALPLVAFIRKTFPLIRAGELALAVEMDIAGRFGEAREPFNNISPKYLQAVMQRYEASIRQDYWKEWQANNNTIKEPTLEEKEEGNRKWVARLKEEINACIEDGRTPRWITECYRYLVKNGLIALKKEDTAPLWERAKEARRVELKQKLSSGAAFAEIAHIKNTLARYDEGHVGDFDRYALSFKAKELAVMDWITSRNGEVI